MLSGIGVARDLIQIKMVVMNLNGDVRLAYADKDGSERTWLARVGVSKKSDNWALRVGDEICFSLKDGVMKGHSVDARIVAVTTQRGFEGSVVHDLNEVAFRPGHRAELLIADVAWLERRSQARPEDARLAFDPFAELDDDKTLMGDNVLAALREGAKGDSSAPNSKGASASSKRREEQKTKSLEITREARLSQLQQSQSQDGAFEEIDDESVHPDISETNDVVTTEAVDASQKLFSDLPLEPSGVLGNLSQVSVVEILQGLELSQKVARIDISSEHGLQGTLYVDKAVLVSAYIKGRSLSSYLHRIHPARQRELQDHNQKGPGRQGRFAFEGKYAFYLAQALQVGTYRIRFGVQDNEPNILKPFSFLMLDMLREVDEAGKCNEQTKSAQLEDELSEKFREEFSEDTRTNLRLPTPSLLAQSVAEEDAVETRLPSDAQHADFAEQKTAILGDRATILSALKNAKLQDDGDE